MKKYFLFLFVFSVLGLSGSVNVEAAGGALTPGSIIFANAGGAAKGQDNANLFWNDTTNRLGVGTNIPLAPLHIIGSILRLDNYAAAPTLSLNRGNGTSASPLSVITGDELGRADMSGYTGTSFAPGARLSAAARENWTGSANGADLIFSTTASGTTAPVEKMRLMGTGSLNLGGSNTENYNLHVQENGRVEIVGSGFGSSKTVIAARYANGTMTAPTHVTIGQIMGEFAIGGYKDTAYTTSASAYMLGTATETFSDSATGTKLEFGTTANGTTGTVTKMVLDQNGFVGIGDTTPDTLLDVETTSASDIATFTNSTGTCSVNPSTGGMSCTSDKRAKKDIYSIGAKDALAKILALVPVTFHWKADSASVPATPGFIAQDVESVIPQAVETDATTGEKRLNQTTLTPYIVGSIQAVASKQAAIEEEKLVTPEVATDKLCIGSTCITEDDLKAFLEYKASL